MGSNEMLAIVQVEKEGGRAGEEPAREVKRLKKAKFTHNYSQSQNCIGFRPRSKASTGIVLDTYSIGFKTRSSRDEEQKPSSTEERT